jgi:hypothetical protein
MKHLRPLGILFATVAVFSAFQFASVILGKTDSEAVTRLTSFGLSLAFVLWVMADAQSRRRTPCFEFGFLVAVYFPVSLAWYVVWSRGWRAVFILAGFYVLMFVPWLSAVVAWILRNGLV